MRLLFEPLDVLLFRDSRPFHAGESFGARSMLPLPSVFYGAIRTYLLDQGNIDFATYATAEDPAAWNISDQRPLLSVLGTPKRRGTLCVKGPWLSEGDSPLFPAPLDLTSFKETLNELSILKPLENPPMGWSPPLQGMKPLWVRDSRVFIPISGFLTEQGMLAYLQGLIPGTGQYRNPAELLERESRIGIGLTKQKTTAEGKFYAAEFLRFRDGSGILCDIQGIDGLALDDGLIFVGGERRMARLLVKSHAQAPSATPTDQLFKVVLITPAIFAQGWQPQWLREDGTGEWKGLKIQLVAAAVGKPLIISGFDLARRLPKPIRRAVPAGSVYYFKLLDGEASKIAEVFHYQAISDESPEAGFGVALVGGWSYA